MILEQEFKHPNFYSSIYNVCIVLYIIEEGSSIWSFNQQNIVRQTLQKEYNIS